MPINTAPHHFYNTTWIQLLSATLSQQQDSKTQGYDIVFPEVSRSKPALFGFPGLARKGRRTKDPEVTSPNPK